MTHILKCAIAFSSPTIPSVRFVSPANLFLLPDKKSQQSQQRKFAKRENHYALWSVSSLSGYLLSICLCCTPIIFSGGLSRALFYCCGMACYQPWSCKLGNWFRLVETIRALEASIKGSAAGVQVSICFICFVC